MLKCTRDYLAFVLNFNKANCNVHNIYMDVNSVTRKIKNKWKVFSKCTTSQNLYSKYITNSELCNELIISYYLLQNGNNKIKAIHFNTVTFTTFLRISVFSDNI